MGHAATLKSSMKLLHRHLFASVALTSLIAVAVLASILLLGNALKDLLGLLLAGQLDPWQFLRLVGLLVPFVCTYALPMGLLTGILLVLGRMSADREIIAIRAAGVSVAGISAPILFFALLGVAASLLVNFQLMPAARVAYQRELADAVRTNPLSFIVPRTFIRDFPGRVIYVGAMKGEVMQDIWVWDLDKQARVQQAARASAGRIVYDEEGNKLVLTLEDARAEARDPKDPEDFTKVRGAATWGRATFDLPLDRLAGRGSVRVKTKWLTIGDLFKKWASLSQPAEGQTREQWLDERMHVQMVIHEKASMAFSVLGFALIGIPLGIKVSRKETTANLGVALALAMAYYFSTVVVGWFDNKPAFRPDLLMWVPALSLQAVGFWLFRRVDRA